ncbi:MAG: hypothetical protein Kow0029_05370 [Candidatus Rifleibacteriota bacterium]
MKKLYITIFVFVIIAGLPAQSDASFFSDAMAKARNIMQGAFQMTFLPSVPVIFYKDSFNKMFEHAQKSVDNIHLQYNGQIITRDKFQDDKALHIKKSAELALHIKSLIGSAYLAYGITMVVGLIKEAIDGSFLNPNGSRSKEDVVADHVGAMAVFGREKFDAALQNKLGAFVKENSSANSNTETDRAVQQFEERTEETIQTQKQVNPFAEKEIDIGNSLIRQRLLKLYYDAASRGDSEEMKKLAVELRSTK